MKSVLRFGRLTLLFALAVGFIFGGMVLLPKAALADDTGLAKSFSNNPFATSREEAMRIRESAFRSISLPSPVITQFLRVTEKPGQKVTVGKGEHFESLMMHGIVYHDVVVDPNDVPMPAERWEIHWDRRTFSVFLTFPSGDKPYWSFKIRTDKTVMACSTEVEHIPVNNVARAT